MTATLIIILFLLGAAAVALLPLSALMLIERKAGQEKQQEAVMRSGNVQSRPATVVSIMPTSLVILSTLILFLLNMLDDKGLLSDDMQPSDSYYLMVEWTNPETQGRVTGRTKKMKGPCPYKVGDTVSILVHPDIPEVWLNEQPAT